MALQWYHLRSAFASRDYWKGHSPGCCSGFPPLRVPPPTTGSDDTVGGTYLGLVLGGDGFSMSVLWTNGSLSFEPLGGDALCGLSRTMSDEAKQVRMLATTLTSPDNAGEKPTIIVLRQRHGSQTWNVRFFTPMARNSDRMRRFRSAIWRQSSKE